MPTLHSIIRWIDHLAGDLQTDEALERLLRARGEGKDVRDSMVDMALKEVQEHGERYSLIFGRDTVAIVYHTGDTIRVIDAVVLREGQVLK